MRFLLLTCALAAMVAVGGCSRSGGFCGSAANKDKPVCRMTDEQQAAIPVKQEWWHPSLMVTVHPMESAAKREGLRQAAGGHGGMALSGLAVPDPDSGRCDLFVAFPPTPSARDYETVGHELMHCVAGGYHPDMLTGRPSSSYLTPRQAAAEREGYLKAVGQAENQSRWTIGCTFGVGGCPPPSKASYPPARITLRRATAPQLDMIGRQLGRNVGEGMVIAERAAGRCDIYMTPPPTYLGRGMELLGRRMMDCFTAQPTAPEDAARLRALADKAVAEGE